MVTLVTDGGIKGWGSVSLVVRIVIKGSNVFNLMAKFWRGNWGL